MTVKCVTSSQKLLTHSNTGSVCPVPWVWYQCTPDQIFRSMTEGFLWKRVKPLKNPFFLCPFVIRLSKRWVKPLRHWVTKLSQNVLTKQGNKAYLNFRFWTAVVRHLASLFHLHVGLNGTAAPSGASILEEQRSREAGKPWENANSLSIAALTHQTISVKLTSLTWEQEVCMCVLLEQTIHLKETVTSELCNT